MGYSDSHSEYSRSTVPESATVSGWRVALIKLGIVVALPGFVIGAQIGSTLGLKDGAFSILIGGVMLMGMAMLTGTVAVKTRLSTSLITQFAFGRLGGRIVNAILALTLLGWFGVTAEIFANSVQGVLTQLGLLTLPLWTYIIAGGTLMTITTIYGFSALQRLSNLTIPLLFLVLLWATYRSISLMHPGKFDALAGEQGGLVLGISAVVGGLAASICVFPDLSRFTRTTRDVKIAASMTYSVGLPIVLTLSAIIGVATGKTDIIDILTVLGLGIPALAFLTFKAWATNSGNLYSACLGSATLFPNVPQPTIVVSAGIIGIVLAAIGITSHLIPFLLFLSIAIPPVAGIYISDYFFVKAKSYDLSQLSAQPNISYPAFIAWAGGFGFALLTSYKSIVLTRMPAADSVLIGLTLYLLIVKYVMPRMMVARIDEASQS